MSIFNRENSNSESEVNSSSESIYSDDESIIELDKSREIVKTSIDNIFEDEIKELDKEFNNVITTDIPQLILKINKLYQDLKKKNDDLSKNFNDKYNKKEMKLNKTFIKKEIKLNKKFKDDYSKLKIEKNNFLKDKIMLEELNKNIKILHDKDEIVNLNIGGVIYTTKLSTLIGEKFSYFSKIFSNKDKIEKDKNGNYFIDRDGESFRYILNWLRDKDSTHFPRKRSEIYNLLKNDVKFYNLKSLERILNFSSNRFDEDDYVICQDNDDIFKYIICKYNYSDNRKYLHVSNYWKLIDNKLFYLELKSFEDQIRRYDLEFDMFFSEEETCGEYFIYKINDIEKYENYISNIDLFKNNCSICLKKFKINEWIHKTACNHTYHLNCLSQWILKNSDPNCPLCRKKIFKLI